MNKESAESGCQTDLRATRVRRKIVHKHGFTANNLSNNRNEECDYFSEKTGLSW